MKTYREDAIYRAVQKAHEDDFVYYRINHSNYCFTAYKTNDGDFIALEGKSVENKWERAVIVFNTEESLLKKLGEELKELNAETEA